MRILIISHGIYPLDPAAGVELFTSESIQFLSKEHEITVLVFTHNRSSQKTIITENYLEKIKVIRVPGSKNQKPDPNFREIHFRGILQSIRPDLIYILSPYYFPFSLIDEFEKMKIPSIVHLHDFYLMCPRIKLTRRNGKLCSGPKRLRCTRCLKKIIRPISFLAFYSNFPKRMFSSRNIIEKAHAILCVSNYVAKRYSKFGLDLSKVITVPPIYRRSNVQTPKVKNKSVLKICFFGGASVEKGINILANSTTRLQCPWQLTIYNVPENKQSRIFRLFKGNEDKVTIKGSFAPEMLDEIFSELDLLLVPSIWPETYGRVIDEAISRGVIVLAAQVGGIAERIVDGLNGFVVPPNDPIKLAEKISYIFKHLEDLHKSMRLNPLLQQKDNYAEKLNKIFKSVAENPHKSGFILDHEEDVIRISRVTNKSREFVEQCLLNELHNPGSTVNTSWLAYGSPKGKTEIEAFYKSTESYLYDLIVAHSTWERALWRNTALSTLIKLDCKSLLDYGAGIGHDSLFFASIGIKVTYYDMNEYLRKFAEDSAKYKNIPLITTTNIDVLPDGLFDSIYCTEVLEHVPNPLIELERMRRLIKHGGYLLTTESFGSVGDKFLTHLPSLAAYSGQLSSLADKVGFSLRETIPIPGNTMYVLEGV